MKLKQTKTSSGLKRITNTTRKGEVLLKVADSAVHLGVVIIPFNELINQINSAINYIFTNFRK